MLRVPKNVFILVACFLFKSFLMVASEAEQHVAESFYYRAYLNGSPTQTYVLGTCHVVPYDVLQEGIRYSIEDILNQEGSKLYSENGNQEHFFDASEDSDVTVSKFEEFCKKNTYVLLDIPKELEREEKSFTNTEKEKFQKEVSRVELAWAKNLKQHLDEYELILKASWFDHESLSAVRELHSIIEKETAQVTPERAAQLTENAKKLKPLFYSLFLDKMLTGNSCTRSQSHGMDESIEKMFKDEGRSVFSLDSETTRRQADLAQVKEMFKKLERSDNPYKTIFSVLKEKAEAMLKILKERKEPKVLEFGEDFTLKDVALSHPTYFSGEYQTDKLKLTADIGHRNFAWLPNIATSIKRNFKSSNKAQLFIFGMGHLQCENGLLYLLAKEGIELRRFNPEVNDFLRESSALTLGFKDRGAMVQATRHNKLEILKFLSHTFDPNQEDAKGLVPLVLAAFCGYQEIVLFLLSLENIEVDLEDSDGTTALYSAAQKGHLGIVDLLLSAGANPEFKTFSGNTCLDAAKYSGNKDLEYLIMNMIARKDSVSKDSKFYNSQEVIVKGLTSEVGQLLNGKIASIVRFNEERQRYIVKFLEDGSEKALKKENLEALLSRIQKVSITSLKSQEGQPYNGRIGYIKEYSVAMGKYAVDFHWTDKTPIWISRRNLIDLP